MQFPELGIAYNIGRYYNPPMIGGIYVFSC